MMRALTFYFAALVALLVLVALGWLIASTRETRPAGPAFGKANLRRDVDDAAPKFGMPAEMRTRFARSAIAGETLGLSLFSLEPNFRIPFGHRHESQEEVYVVVRGSGRIKVGDEVVELGEWDAIRIPKNTMRDVEAGPDGIEYLAFGAGEDPNEVEMSQGWWSDEALSLPISVLYPE